MAATERLARRSNSTVVAGGDHGGTGAERAALHLRVFRQRAVLHVVRLHEECLRQARAIHCVYVPGFSLSNQFSITSSRSNVLPFSTQKTV